MPAPRLKPGQSGKPSFQARGDRVRARARLRLFDGSYVQASGTGANEREARLACEEDIRTRLAAAPGDSELRPDDLVRKAARLFIDQCRIEETWPNPPRPER